MESTTEERAERARKTMTHYEAADPEDLETSILDLIADLYHLADKHGCSIERIKDLAWMHYEAEVFEEL